MDRVIEIVRNVDVGCMPSRAELAGVSLRNLLRPGVPIIATDVGGIPDIVYLSAGHVVPPEISPGDAAQALLVCLTSQIGWPNFRRMRGADGTTQAGGARFGS